MSIDRGPVDKKTRWGGSAGEEMGKEMILLCYIILYLLYSQLTEYKFSYLNQLSLVFI